MANQALGDQKQRKVEVKRDRLLNVLKHNLTKHKKEYQEALEGYKEAALKKIDDAETSAQKELSRSIERARQQINDFNPNKPQSTRDYFTVVQAINIEMKVPRDYSKEYEAAIDMVDWDVNDTLELTHAEFQCFVRDVWDWSNDFAQITQMYNNKKF